MNSNNEFRLSILEASLITRHELELFNQKQFYHYFSTTPLDHVKKTLLPVPTILAYGNFSFLNQFSLQAFLRDNIPGLLPPM